MHVKEFRFGRDERPLVRPGLIGLRATLVDLHALSGQLECRRLVRWGLQLVGHIDVLELTPRVGGDEETEQEGGGSDCLSHRGQLFHVARHYTVRTRLCSSRHLVMFCAARLVVGPRDTQPRKNGKSVGRPTHIRSTRCPPTPRVWLGQTPSTDQHETGVAYAKVESTMTSRLLPWT